MHPMPCRGARLTTAMTLAAAAVWLGGGRAALGASLTPTGGFASNPSFIRSLANGVSPDGVQVVGSSTVNVGGSEAVRYTSAGGLVSLGDLPGGFTADSTAYATNGTTIVGRGHSANGYEAFSYTQAGGLVPLGDLAGGNVNEGEGPFDSYAYALNANGTVIVGHGNGSNGLEAVRWSGGVMTPLGSITQQARGVSSDGSVIVGAAEGVRAFRYTAATGATLIPDLPGGLERNTAFAVSGDGQVVVGQATTNTIGDGQQAFRYTLAGGTVGLGDLPGGTVNSSALAVNADGSVIVGYGKTASIGTEAMYYTSPGGMVRLWDLLLANGVNPALDGWTRLETANGVSADGATVAGYGLRNGLYEGFVAVVPEPSAFAGLAVAGLILRRRRGVLR